MVEIWPFNDESSGAKIYENRFYGFVDSGGVAGSFDGYTTRPDAVNAIYKEYEDWGMKSFLSINPDDLGDSAITFISGREYIDRLKVVTEGESESVLFYGSWSE